MRKAGEIIAQALSIVCYPLLMPTYGMLLFCGMMYQTLPLPQGYWWTVCLATLSFTCLIPLSLILMMWWRGQIEDLYIRNKDQRKGPYLFSVIGFGFWCWFVGYTMHAPYFVTCTAIGSTVALVVVMIVNRWWKISAHLTAMGGLMGGICSFSLATGVIPTALLSTVLLMSLMLMYARLYLKAHTPAQVMTGYLLGLLCTTIPSWIVYV